MQYYAGHNWHSVSTQNYQEFASYSTEVP